MPAETRLLSEYLAEHYFGREIHTHFRVGQTPPYTSADPNDVGEVAAARSANRWVDAIVAPPPELVVIEATMWRADQKVSQLQGYLLLLKSTPEYAAWAGYPVHPVLLTAQDDPVAHHLCDRAHIDYVFWEPPWIGEFHAVYSERIRRAPHSGAIQPLDY
jgi:hypothetical protein